MYLQKVTSKKFFLLISWRSLTKIAGSGSGSISLRYGSADPDPYQNFMDPKHWLQLLKMPVGWVPGSGLWDGIPAWAEARGGTGGVTAREPGGHLVPAVAAATHTQTNHRYLVNTLNQGWRSGSGLDPDSIGSVDPDSESGSGSKRAKMTHKSRIFFFNFMFRSVGWPLLRADGFFCNLDVLYGGLGPRDR
jgi:hypothetical protein